MKKRKRLSRKASYYRFRNSAKRVHPKNLKKVIHRGGFML